MDSINWIGRSALVMLSLSLSGATALAQENASATGRVPVNPRSEDRVQGDARDLASGGGELRRKARSAMLDWGTGGFELRGERLASGSRLLDTARLGGRRQRTYAADVRLWESAAPGMAFEVGAHFERTNRRAAGGPLLAETTKTVARTAYVRVQLGSSSIRLVGFDHGGWSEGAAGRFANRVTNGEPAPRRGAAIEIGMFGLQPGNARPEHRFTLRMEHGQIAARSGASATLSWKGRL
jgi:hypothetical protein